MDNLIEITPEDISLLNDNDLRTLIGRLCEADYRSMGLSTKGIEWGGHQDASDGGLDVVVQTDIAPPHNSYIPRSNSCFQVKKQKMPFAKIDNEMKPKGILRNSIKSLIKCSGAYIIVSSGDSIAAAKLEDHRIKHMRNAIKDENGYENLKIDFYDRGRIATWLRNHPSLILWVRNIIKRPLQGWHSYDNWARAPEGLEEKYLLDDKLRMYDDNSSDYKNREISTIEGISRLRNLLSSARNCIRLVGLSGVGKTRLVQALFDSRIGEKSLNKSQVFYTDISYTPVPNPVFMAEQLILSKAKGLLIIDNCPPDLHRQVTKICSEAKSTISLLTIEYDVRDDLSEETSIFRLEPSGEETIEKILRFHFPQINPFNASTIARFSGGNARLAIALANTVRKGETLSGFRDEELFTRLFFQRNEFNESLYLSAQVLSLVYSFDGIDCESENSELKVLALLVETSASTLYRHVDILIKRDLIQARNIWRAILPPAIANRLAKHALDSINKNKIVKTILNSGKERLIKSFTRRLGYLHDNDNAILIAGELLTQESLIESVSGKFNSFKIEIFKNIAPLAPDKTLKTIEDAANKSVLFTSRENPHFYEIVIILKHLAFDPNLFNKCAKLISRFAVTEKTNENNNSIRKVLSSFFYIRFSGTHASVDSREEIILDLLGSENEDKKELGLSLLDTALETMYFTPIYDFDFGAWPRDSGYQPKTQTEITYWYEKFVTICGDLALSSQSTSTKARSILAKRLGGLWIHAQIYDAIEKMALQIHQKQAWNEGWLSLREIIQKNSTLLKEEILKKLIRLEKRLRPNNLLDLARACIFSSSNRSFTVDDDFCTHEDTSSMLEQAEEITRKIGIQVAQDLNSLDMLLPDLFSNEANIRLSMFGEGIAEGSENKDQIWEKLQIQFSKISSDTRPRIDILRGFLSSCSKSDRVSYNRILDRVLDDVNLREWLPFLETSSIIDANSISRLHKILDYENVKIQYFKNLAYGKAHETISDDDLSNLLNKILLKNGGIEIVIEILSMRFHDKNQQSLDYSINLIETSRNALSQYSFPDENLNVNIDSDLSHVAEICLYGEDAKNSSMKICNNFLNACMSKYINSIDYPHLLAVIANFQPFVFLDFFMRNEFIKKYHQTLLRHDLIDQIPQEQLISWCDFGPLTRYPLIASVLNVFIESEGPNSEVTFNPKVSTILNRTPELRAVLEKLSVSVWCGSGWGSRADMLQRRLKPLSDLCKHTNSQVSSWAKKMHSSITDAISRDRSLISQPNHQYASFE